MTVRWLTAFIDRPAATFDAAADFWLQVTASTLSSSRGEHQEFATLMPPDGDPYLRVQRTTDGSGGCHLDVHVENIASTAARAVDLGAREVQALDDVTILRSPAGLPFCVVGHDGERIRPAPRALPSSSSRVLVDQLCIDIPPAAFEGECGFWAALAGWELRHVSKEFSRVMVPPLLPLRLLLQRLDESGDHPSAAAHLDLACDDREAAVAVHTTLGAQFVRRHEHWIVMTDPSGLPYCLTRRSPDTGLVG